MMIAAGESGGPGLRVAGCTSPEILGIKFVEAGTGQSQFAGGSARTNLANAITMKQMTNERSGQSFDQLLFFIGAMITGKVDFSLWN
jgi:hypothetical protein